MKPPSGCRRNARGTLSENNVFFLAGGLRKQSFFLQFFLHEITYLQYLIIIYTTIIIPIVLDDDCQAHGLNTEKHWETTNRERPFCWPIAKGAEKGELGLRYSSSRFWSWTYPTTGRSNENNKTKTVNLWPKSQKSHGYFWTICSPGAGLQSRPLRANGSFGDRYIELPTTKMSAWHLYHDMPHPHPAYIPWSPNDLQCVNVFILLLLILLLSSFENFPDSQRLKRTSWCPWQRSSWIRTVGVREDWWPNINILLYITLYFVEV